MIFMPKLVATLYFFCKSIFKMCCLILRCLKILSNSIYFEIVIKFL